MKYSTKPRFRKYIKGYDSLSFAKNFGNKYGKKLIDTATKTGMVASIGKPKEKPKINK